MALSKQVPSPLVMKQWPDADYSVRINQFPLPHLVVSPYQIRFAPSLESILIVRRETAYIQLKFPTNHF